MAAECRGGGDMEVKRCLPETRDGDGGGVWERLYGRREKAGAGKRGGRSGFSAESEKPRRSGVLPGAVVTMNGGETACAGGETMGETACPGRETTGEIVVPGKRNGGRNRRAVFTGCGTRGVAGANCPRQPLCRPVCRPVSPGAPVRCPFRASRPPPSRTTGNRGGRRGRSGCR